MVLKPSINTVTDLLIKHCMHPNLVVDWKTNQISFAKSFFPTGVYTQKATYSHICHRVPCLPALLNETLRGVLNIPDLMIYLGSMVGIWASPEFQHLILFLKPF